MESRSKRREGGDDRISELPDPLICHILSFLPTVYAVWTTILSKRWNNFWISLPNLDFYEKDFPANYRIHTNQVMNFVTGALSFRGASNVHKFRLRISRPENFSDKDFARIRSWIRTAIRCNVAEMDIDIGTDSTEPEAIFKMPPNLLKCKTLLVLKVHSNCITYAPTKGCFPSLKVLSVTAIWPDAIWPDDDSLTSLGKFFASCPVLEELSIDLSLRFREDFNINISAPELKKLSISFDCSSYLHGTNFVINAPKLENLELDEKVLSNYFLETVKSLVRAEIHFSGSFTFEEAGFSSSEEDYGFMESNQQVSNNATASLEKVSNVKCLSLSGEPSRLEACSLPVFDNLSRLELLLYGYFWELLMELLKRSPKLEYLVLKKEDICSAENFSKWNPSEPLPVCLLSHLKTIFMKGFLGTEDETEVLKYFLKNGEVLEKMTVYAGKGVPRDVWYEKKKVLSKELSMFEWGSKTCRVEFI